MTGQKGQNKLLTIILDVEVGNHAGSHVLSCAALQGVITGSPGHNVSRLHLPGQIVQSTRAATLLTETPSEIHIHDLLRLRLIWSSLAYSSRK